MKDDARDTVRNASLILLQRGAQTVGGVGFALLVPRLMGPEQYGRYALVTSVAFWLALVSGLGLVNATIGLVLFVLKGMSPNVELRDIIFGVTPFIFLMLGFIWLLYAFPEIVLWLPRTIG